MNFACLNASKLIVRNLPLTPLPPAPHRGAGDSGCWRRGLLRSPWRQQEQFTPPRGRGGVGGAVLAAIVA